MIDRWFSVINLPMTFEQFEKLPRDAAYKYEYWDGVTRLTPRPKQYHALLELRPMEESTRIDAQDPVRIRPLAVSDWETLPKVFSGAFHRVQPFASLGDDSRLDAARQCLQNTREGGDGPLVEPACFVAEGRDDRVLGAILVTAMPNVDITEFHDLRWKETPPSDWLERRLGRPHLTWIFVGPWHVGHGVGTALLAAAAREILARGYRELATTFLLGNDSSLLWHWRNGFRLLAYPGSMRHWRTIQRTIPPDS